MKWYCFQIAAGVFGLLLPFRALAAIECGQEVAGQVVLDADLDCEGTALVVVREGTIVQLNGHTIAGRVACDRRPEDPGVRIAPAARGAQILGPGAIRGFAHGILIDGASNVLVRDTVLTGNCGSGMMAVEALNLKLVQNVVFRNSSSFVKPTGGILLMASDRAVVERNAIFMNGADRDGAGITLVSSSGGEIRMNHITGNSGDGIFLDKDSTGNQVERNLLLASGGSDLVDRGESNALPLNLLESARGFTPPPLLPLPAFPERTSGGVVGCGTMHMLIPLRETVTVTCPQDPGLKGLVNSVVSYRLLHPLYQQLRFPDQCSPAVLSHASATSGGGVTCTNPSDIWNVVLEVRCCLS